MNPTHLDDVIGRACARIAPTWPLDRFIAVNPFWGMIDRPLPEVAAALRGQSGAHLLMPRAWYRQAHDDGRLRDAHLQAAIAERGAATTVAQLHALLRSEDPTPPRRSRVVDLVDAERDLVHQMSWRDFVTNSVSQLCAAYFDDGQATLPPDRSGGLYASWRRSAVVDKAPALLMGLRSYRAVARALPSSARALIELALDELGVAEAEVEAYLWGLLLEQNGWASWSAYCRWTARLAHADDDAVVDLLAIRLAWEWMLFRAGAEPLARRWQLAMASWPAVDAACAAHGDDWLVHRALELAWQQTVVRQLPAGLATPRPHAPAVQAVFCIDVRSEVLRRALESVTPAAQTLGFAGFFGLPIAYQPLGSVETRPQLPGLLAPQLLVTDAGLDATTAARRGAGLDLAQRWRGLKTGAVSTFTFVEAMGLTYAAQLVADSLGRSAAPHADDAGLDEGALGRRQPRLASTIAGEPLTLAQRCDLAAGMLRAMSLTRGFARLVLLAGHGSETRNNPHAAGLDCGACCGQRGEVNARAAAALLNDPAVRAGLAERGIDVPDSTRFLAGLHNTTTEDVTLLELDELPASHVAEVATLRAWLADAAARARRERADSLGLGDEADPARLHAAARDRARDWAQVRAEWGLANNASFLIAPREHCRHLELAGRSFLHEYRFAEDRDFAILELLMTAPMVVAHWINLQYFASTVDNVRYGSGNKVLHNVVGGHLGVFEGNGGDLRIGLPMQSVHDGQRWMHTPLRLSVVIEAPRHAIAAIVAKHAQVRALVDNGWIDLFQLDAEERSVSAYRAGAWVRQPTVEA